MTDVKSQALSLGGSVGRSSCALAMHVRRDSGGGGELMFTAAITSSAESPLEKTQGFRARLAFFSSLTRRAKLLEMGTLILPRSLALPAGAFSLNLLQIISFERVNE